jgi:hypothetical protein
MTGIQVKWIEYNIHYFFIYYYYYYNLGKM